MQHWAGMLAPHFGLVAGPSNLRNPQKVPQPFLTCHSECSEESPAKGETLHCAQGDMMGVAGLSTHTVRSRRLGCSMPHSFEKDRAKGPGTYQPRAERSGTLGKGRDKVKG